MSTTTERATRREHGTTPPLIHNYPRCLPYAVSGAQEPQPGDIALCGFVKRLPAGVGAGLPLSCAVCIDLKGRPL